MLCPGKPLERHDHRYKRTARSFSELDLGSPVPLSEAIPELAQLFNLTSGTEPAGTGCAAGCAGDWDSSMKSSVPNGIRTRVTALKGPCPGPG